MTNLLMKHLKKSKNYSAVISIWYLLTQLENQLPEDIFQIWKKFWKFQERYILKFFTDSKNVGPSPFQQRPTFEGDYPKTTYELRARIKRGFRIINRNQEVINRAALGILNRAEMCLEAQGRHFEQLRRGRDNNNNAVVYTSGEESE